MSFMLIIYKIYFLLFYSDGLYNIGQAFFLYNICSFVSGVDLLLRLGGQVQGPKGRERGRSSWASPSARGCGGAL